MLILNTILSLNLISNYCFSADQYTSQPSTSSISPTYLSLGQNLNDFSRFANGGPDGNWYIGYNNAWVVELPPAPAGEFPRAFIGAKIGRAKTKPDPDRPWLNKRIDGKIYMAVSQTPAFAAEQSFMITQAADIPLESGEGEDQAGAGEAQWFWAEVPPALISFTQPNYLIIWSITPYFLSASSSPILAAMTAPAAPDKPYAWNDQSISGVPPRQPAETLTPLGNLLPALSVKLVPPGGPPVFIKDFRASSSGKDVIVSFSAEGRDVSRAWLEISQDQIDWERSGPLVFREPFSFSLDRQALPKEAAFLRAAASDALGDAGYGPPWPLR